MINFWFLESNLRIFFYEFSEVILVVDPEAAEGTDLGVAAKGKVELDLERGLTQDQEQDPEQEQGLDQGLY